MGAEESIVDNFIKYLNNIEQMLEYVKELEAELLRLKDENQMLLDKINKR